MSAVTTRPSEVPAPMIPVAVQAAVAAANAGDASALPALRRALAEHPDLVARLGDLAAHVERGLVALVAGPSLVAAEAVAAHLERLRAELGDAESAPLERLLIRRVVLCWLACHAAELERGELLRGSPGERLGAADKRVDRAHGRLLSAVKALATVRRLLEPVVVVSAVGPRVGGVRPRGPVERGRVRAGRPLFTGYSDASRESR